MDCRKPIILLTFIALALALAVPVQAQTTSWQVNYQHVVLNVQPSGQVYMTYNVSAVIQQGIWNEVWIPQTDPNQKVIGVVDGYGVNHTSYIDSGQIKVQGFNLKPTNPVTLTIYSTIDPFVYTSDKAGYDIVTFTPPWWDMTITDTQVKYILPAAMNVSDVFTGSRQYSGIGTENGLTIVYFNNTYLSNNQQFDTAVSFPDSYMNTGAVTSSSSSSGISSTGVGSVFGVLGSLLSCLCANPVIFIFIIVILGFGFGQFGRSSYTSPVVSMDGIGINKDLDPVEAATLLRIDPKRVLTMVMFGLMKKGNVKLISTDPIQLELVSRQDLNYYEKLFADAIKNNTLDEEGLLNCFKVLARRVVDKTRPYSRKDTELYYKQKIDEAWAADTGGRHAGIKATKVRHEHDLAHGGRAVQAKDQRLRGESAGQQHGDRAPDLLVVPVLLRDAALLWRNGRAAADGRPYASDRRTIHGRQAHEHNYGQRGDLRELHL